MERIINIQNAAHYKWGNNCDGWHFFKSENLTVIRETMPAGSKEILHYHKKSVQFFYILAGEATFEIEAEIFKAGANTGSFIKPGEQHKISNNSDKDLEFIVVSSPPSHSDRIDLQEAGSETRNPEEG